MGSPLTRKAREGIDITFGDGEDAVTFWAFSVGRATYVALADEHATDDDEERTAEQDNAHAAALLGCLSVEDDDGPRRLTDDEVGTLLDSEDWSTAEVAQLIGAVRVANERPLGKVSTGPLNGSGSSGPPDPGE